MWQALHICIMVIFCHSSQSLSGWMGTNHGQTFSGFSRDVLLGSNPGSVSVTQVHSQSCHKVLAHFLGQFYYYYYLFIYLFFYIETFSVNPSDPHESVAKSARWNLSRSLEIPDCMNSQLLDIFCVNLPINNVTEH